ncbi:uncharacterized protein P174DRAFT_464612 [Aspergillus novofumigatus IBT 16806]|uniref:Uncharacterized protein n=1 Tax=Aspergillus novofumigatus (strain IBT 16806) TaxID=1392255 RepID=A0A2I1BU28_ASPN1|nr:uncharacterized protein P174DRAFT_464612 [Aspergillus novofumigatus IBT 16806]PKX88866.1 hypothetical protein P174DRAFT_464612 [Aspergillus novofumigatus IBT 16806]
MASDPDLMKRINPDTVDALQLLALGKSRIDSKIARGLVLGGQAFAEFTNFDGLVLSLYKFFEDFKYLKSCAHCVNSIFVLYLGSEVEERLIQTSESTFQREAATDAECLDMGDNKLLVKSSHAIADKRLRFQSPEIKVIIEGSPDHKIARAALLQARKPNHFYQIVDYFAAAVPNQPEIIHELLVDSTVKPQAHCGLP